MYKSDAKQRFYNEQKAKRLRVYRSDAKQRFYNEQKAKRLRVYRSDAKSEAKLFHVFRINLSKGRFFVICKYRGTIKRLGAFALAGMVMAASLSAPLSGRFYVYAMEEETAESETVLSEEEEVGGEVGISEVTTDLSTSGLWSMDPHNAPLVTAEGAILMDADTGAILYAKNINTEYYPASITKLLTCLVAIENCDLSETVEFSTNAVFGIERSSSNIGIDVGETLSMQDCLYAILLASANEVALAVAEHVAGSTEDFAAMMNAKAKELGCTHSNFVNPNGLPNDAHYTSAHDMALIAKAFFANETLATISGTTGYHISASATQPDEIDLMNHHRMLPGCQYGTKYNYEYTVGGKTGYTNVARQTLVTCAQKDDMRLIVVVMKDETPSHYTDTKALFEYGFNYFKKLSTEELLSTEEIDHLIQSVLPEVNYTLGEIHDVIVPDNVTADQISTDIEYKEISNIVQGTDVVNAGELAGGTGVIHFYYDNMEAGNIEFTYTRPMTQLSEEQTAAAIEAVDGTIVTEDAEQQQTGSGFSIVAVLLTIIKVLLSIVLAGAAGIALFFGIRSLYHNNEKSRRRKEVMERARARRAQQTFLEDLEETS